MLEQLIEEGIRLESKTTRNQFGGNYFKGVEFEEWIAKVIRFLEEDEKDSAVTKRVIDRFMNMNQNNNFEVYQMALGALKSLS
ncbi:MAG TPA: hypothetical protein VNS08_14065 [Ureibacillus sp.]|nr:hypothetical protein [Ureibacillus sp.]